LGARLVCVKGGQFICATFDGEMFPNKTGSYVVWPVYDEDSATTITATVVQVGGDAAAAGRAQISLIYRAQSIDLVTL